MVCSLARFTSWQMGALISGDPMKTVSLEQEINPWEAQSARFNFAAQKLNLDEGLWKVLQYPNRELIVHIPVSMDNGKLEVFTGFRVQHSIARGPAKGGIICDPHKMSMGELERMTRRYTAELIEFIGPEKDVPAPDVNTNEQVMAWIMDTYSMHMRQTVTSVVTGKPINIGGSRGRREATGRGIMIVCDEAVKKLGLRPEETRVIVQGYGNVGSNAAQLMAQAGYKIVGVIEVDGAIYNKNGINIEALSKHRERVRGIADFPEAEKADPAELLLTECEILVPAATENQITSQNASRVKCRILAEGANGPTTAAADEILADKKVFVIPDILCNAGGVTTSYFEWVQDRQGYFWKESVVNEQLEHIMKNAFEDVVRYAETHGVNNRIAAYMLAIDRVAYTIRQRGIYA